MRVLVTGGKGMLGSDVCREFSAANHEVIPVTSGHFDISDTDATLRYIRDIRPDYIIHTAAYTDVDGCERNPDIAYRVNALGTWNVAAAATEVGAALVAISTDFVFDGQKGEPYTEFDAVNPLGVYAASKLQGEQLAIRACPRTYVARTSWLYGVDGKCFPQTMLRLAETRPELSVVGDQTGTPTFTLDLAQALLDVIRQPLYGIYHMSNSGQTTWHGFAQATLSAAGKGQVNVKAIRSEDWPSPTKRPSYSVLRSYVRELQGKPAMRPWQEALAHYLELTGQRA
ncbi:MAG TPA: dTDP-4-dehydrorhamnose reductase [Capsulimonadaceae bacterium]|jgi:dTDP-4-dehydrorhamnose reductase